MSFIVEILHTSNLDFLTTMTKTKCWAKYMYASIGYQNIYIYIYNLLLLAKIILISFLENARTEPKRLSDCY